MVGLLEGVEVEEGSNVCHDLKEWSSKCVA